VKWLTELAHEHGQLKRMEADLSLEHAALKDGLATQRYGLLGGREVVTHLMRVKVPVRSAGLPRGGVSRATDDRPRVDWARRDAPGDGPLARRWWLPTGAGAAGRGARSAAARRALGGVISDWSGSTASVG
jgi:hypothetical protein